MIGGLVIIKYTTYSSKLLILQTNCRMSFIRTILFSILFIGQSMSIAQSLKVMTYNIRLDTPQDGVNAWPNRTVKVVQLIEKYDPDIFGVQEALPNQVKDLQKEFPEYTFVGVGRDDGKEKGEYSAIFFKKGRFGLLNSNTFWLSETPDVPGSKSWDAAFTRVVTWARLFDTKTKREFTIYNTHFDHIGLQARTMSAAYLSGYIAGKRVSQKQPVIVVGDFNFERDEASYDAMLAGKELMDAKPPGTITGTFCGFEVGKMECKGIDYIFHTAEWVPRKYTVITDNDGKYYPSDHLPVLVEFERSELK
jgi:endonuclease/exonuclease/phosphatase family metal-dependent hydrolase